MLLNTTVAYCDSEYQQNNCTNCTYPDGCQHNCEKCLEYIHFPERAPSPRTYDCERMAEYYVCKYSYKYASELVYAFCQLRDVWNKPLKVMSVGCGPCTDLFALDHLQNEGRLGHIEYRGIDLNEIWRKIHRNIAHNQENNQVRFFYENVFDFIDVVNRKNWLPDLLIFQYVFSDMRKTADDTEVNGFIEHMSEFINRLPVNSYIILNDINLQNSQGGGRNYFDRLYRHLHGCDYLDCHFNNNNRQNHYHYGDEYTSNNLIWPIPNNLHQYSPFESCASAQKIIKRVR